MFLADYSSQERPSARAAGPAWPVCQNFEGKGHTMLVLLYIVHESFQVIRGAMYKAKHRSSQSAMRLWHLNVPRLWCRSLVAQTFFVRATSTVLCLLCVAFTPAFVYRYSTQHVHSIARGVYSFIVMVMPR